MIGLNTSNVAEKALATNVSLAPSLAGSTPTTNKPLPLGLGLESVASTSSYSS